MADAIQSPDLSLPPTHTNTTSVDRETALSPKSETPTTSSHAETSSTVGDQAWNALLAINRGGQAATHFALEYSGINYWRHYGVQGGAALAAREVKEFLDSSSDKLSSVSSEWTAKHLGSAAPAAQTLVNADIAVASAIIQGGAEVAIGSAQGIAIAVQALGALIEQGGNIPKNFLQKVAQDEASAIPDALAETAQLGTEIVIGIPKALASAAVSVVDIGVEGYKTAELAYEVSTGNSKVSWNQVGDQARRTVRQAGTASTEAYLAYMGAKGMVKGGLTLKGSISSGLDFFSGSGFGGAALAQMTFALDWASAGMGAAQMGAGAALLGGEGMGPLERPKPMEASKPGETPLSPEQLRADADQLMGKPAKASLEPPPAGRYEIKKHWFSPDTIVIDGKKQFIQLGDIVKIDEKAFVYDGTNLVPFREVNRYAVKLGDTNYFYSKGKFHPISPGEVTASNYLDIDGTVKPAPRPYEQEVVMADGSKMFSDGHKMHPLPSDGSAIFGISDADGAFTTHAPIDLGKSINIRSSAGPQAVVTGGRLIRFRAGEVTILDDGRAFVVPESRTAGLRKEYHFQAIPENTLLMNGDTMGSIKQGKFTPLSPESLGKTFLDIEGNPAQLISLEGRFALTSPDGISAVVGSHSNLSAFFGKRSSVKVVGQRVRIRGLENRISPAVNFLIKAVDLTGEQLYLEGGGKQFWISRKFTEAL